MWFSKVFIYFCFKNFCSKRLENVWNVEKKKFWKKTSAPCAVRRKLDNSRYVALDDYSFVAAEKLLKPNKPFRLIRKAFIMAETSAAISSRFDAFRNQITFKILENTIFSKLCRFQVSKCWRLRFLFFGSKKLRPSNSVQISSMDVLNAPKSSENSFFKVLHFAFKNKIHPN